MVAMSKRSSARHRSIMRFFPMRSFATSPTFRSSTPSSSSSSNAYRSGMNNYKPFVRPFAKVFLGAIFTYQVIHWTWVKLEMDEMKVEKNREVATLVDKAKELAGAQK